MLRVSSVLGARGKIRVLGIDVLCEAGIHAHLVDDDVWPRWRCDIQAPALTVGDDDAPAASTMRISWLTRSGLGPGVRARGALNEEDGYDDGARGRRASRRAGATRILSRSPCWTGGPLVVLTSRSMGWLSRCWFVLRARALWAVLRRRRRPIPALYE